MKAQAMRTLTVSLSAQQVDRLQQAVESGAYSSNSEVVRDALRMWEIREERRALELAALKQAYHEGMSSGEPRDADPARLIEELKAARARG